LHEAFTILDDKIDNPGPSFSIKHSVSTFVINPSAAVAGSSNSQHPQRTRTAGNNQSKFGLELYRCCKFL